MCRPPGAPFGGARDCGIFRRADRWRSAGPKAGGRQRPLENRPVRHCQIVDLAETIWRLLGEKKTQQAVADDLGWTKQRVHQYANLAQIDTKAWQLVSTTVRDFGGQQADAAVDVRSTAVDFTEGLLRVLIPLSAEARGLSWLPAYKKMSEPDREKAKELVDAGLSQRQAAKVLGVDESTVRSDLRENPAPARQDRRRLAVRMSSKSRPIATAAPPAGGSITVQGYAASYWQDNRNRRAAGWRQHRLDQCRPQPFPRGLDLSKMPWTVDRYRNLRMCANLSINLCGIDFVLNRSRRSADFRRISAHRAPMLSFLGCT